MLFRSVARTEHVSVLDAKDLADRQTEGLGLRPAGERLRDGVHPSHASVSIRDDERVAYLVASEIMATKELSKSTYDKAVGQFGEQGTVELISTIGYYAMVGIFLKSFDVPTSTGDKPLK